MLPIIDVRGGRSQTAVTVGTNPALYLREEA